MTDIAAFLTARLDEDERMARFAASTGSGEPGGHWYVDCRHSDHEPDACYVRRVEGDNITIYDEGGHDEDQARHIARHDPARVLADVAAKRAILADYQVVVANNAIAKSTGGDELTTVARDLIIKTLRMVLLRLAAADAHHPDYDESWRP